MIIDSHAHLEMPAFDDDREAVLERARRAGVIFILSIGNAQPEEGSMERALQLCRHHSGLATTAGIHPHDARIASDRWYRQIMDLAGEPEVVAIGEIGLDYHYDFSPRDRQRDVFRDQLILARELGLPIIVHSREAEADTLALLAEYWSPPHPGGIMHCFSGDVDMAQRCLALGLHISFAGNLTFRNAGTLRTAAAAVPPDRLLAETDAPYLAPVPHRGRRNEPAHVALVIEALAETHGLPAPEMARHTTHNFKKLLGERLIE
ncbi:MAG: TatD family hydrolase [Acidobacteria bacterium]|nr:TatD family hydrolase [Acidobacteriota bacterium]